VMWLVQQDYQLAPTSVQCKVRAEVPWERVLKRGKVGQVDTLEHSWEPGMCKDRGLGFSPEAAPSWDADALFWEDKAGRRPSWDTTKRGQEQTGMFEVT